MKKNKFLLLLCLSLVGLIGFFFYHSQPPQPHQTETDEKPSPTIPSFQFKPPPLTLEQIFQKNRKWVAVLPAEKITVLLTTGDVMLGRAINFKTFHSQNFIWPFEKTAKTLKRANFTFINLESPLVENCPLTTGGMKFCADPKNIFGLKFAGIDVANLANNHIGNYGSEGIKTTLSSLNKVNILTTGISGPVFKEKNGERFAFLGYNDTGASHPLITPADKNKISQELNDAKTKADVVVVAFHWGVEYTNQPTKRQQELAHWAIDSGANLVIGHHPHWIQPVEIYKGGVILYSLGNFIFDQAWSEKTKQGIVGRFAFFENQLVDVELLPIEMDNFGQPSFMTANQKTKILEEIEQLSNNYFNRSGSASSCCPLD